MTENLIITWLIHWIMVPAMMLVIPHTVTLFKLILNFYIFYNNTLFTRFCLAGGCRHCWFIHQAKLFLARDLPLVIHPAQIRGEKPRFGLFADVCKLGYDCRLRQRKSIKLQFLEYVDLPQPFFVRFVCWAHWKTYFCEGFHVVAFSLNFHFESSHF